MKAFLFPRGSLTTVFICGRKRSPPDGRLSHGRLVRNRYGHFEGGLSVRRETETYVLCDYLIVGGSGYLPLAVGSRWLYRNPGAPGYLYHDIERTVEYTDGYLSNLAVSSPVALVKDYERCADLDPYVYLNFADQLCDKWKLDEAVGMLKKAVRLNSNEEAVQTARYGIGVLERFAEYRKTGYRFCPSNITASSLEVSETGVKYRRPYLSSFGPYRMGVRGRYEDRIFALKPFRYLDRFMHCLWDEKWVPGYREERTVKDGLTLHFTVEDGGSITVPAGTFENCRKVTLRLEKPADEDDGWYYRDGYRNMDGGLKEYWFAPGVGIVKTAFTWGTSCYAKGLLSAYHVPASKPGGYLPIQVGNGWEYDEPHLTAEGYRAKAIFRIASVTNGEYLMLSSQKFVFLKTEDEYDAFVKGYAE